MQAPTKFQRKCACGGGCPNCQKPQNSGVQLQAKHAHEAVETRVAPVVDEVLQSAGQPLDSTTKEFMESRFGQDFSRVRVHTGAKAAASAKSINALAYTSGNHIAFDAGQYNPSTDAGKHLLAHELVHTMQQTNGVLHRAVSFANPRPSLQDPIPLVLGGGSMLGNTLPGFNGRLMAANAPLRDHYAAIFNMLQPQFFTFRDEQGAKKCKVAARQYNINGFVQMKAITAPTGTKWSGSYAVGTLRNAPTACTGRRSVLVELKGRPDSNALHAKVLAHEQEHFTDFKSVTNDKLKPYHDFLLGLEGSAATEADCVANLTSQIGTKDGEAAKEFVDAWLASVQVYDAAGGTHHSRFQTRINSGCTTARITEQR